MNKTIITTKNRSHRDASVKLNEALSVPYWMGKIANGRTPVARFVGNEDVPNPPAPAWYVPVTGDIYIHADDAGINTDQIVTWGLNAEDKFDCAKACGLLGHEAAHAAISEDLEEAEKLAPHHRSRLTMLEEVRVENHVIRRVPHQRKSLRASFTLILKAMRELDTTDKATIARAWALVQGRTLAGIATAAETKPMDEAARVILGDDTVDALTDLLQEAVTLHLPRQTDRIIEICDEWLELVGEPENDEGDDGCEGEPDGSGAKGTEKGKGKSKSKGKSDGSDEEESEDGSGEGEGDESESDADAEDDESDGSGDGDEDGEAGGKGEGDDDDITEGEGGYEMGVANSFKGEVVENLDLEAKELADAALKNMEEAIAKTWADEAPRETRTKSLVAAGTVFGNKYQSKRLSHREPQQRHRQAVLEVSNVLSNLALPAVSKVTRATPLPPGRMRSREAVRQSAERSQGRMSTAKPWKGTVRRHSTARPLIVGIATDTSGSMKWAEQSVADFAYVYANAGHRIGARTAAVTFGDRVYPIARPGRVMSHVVGKSADDGTESCDYALAALDGVLHLTDPSYAARILVIVSDGCLVKSGESDKVTQWLEEMDRAGTYVLWVGSPGTRRAGGWLGDLAKKLTNFTYITPATGEYGRMVGFEALNVAVLAAVKEHIR